MVAKKSKSKRQTLQTKYKIIKRVKQHEKRLKKGTIANKYKKKSDDNRIPSQWPYKEQLLNEIQAAKDRAEVAKEEQKAKRQAEIVSLYLYLWRTDIVLLMFVPVSFSGKEAESERCHWFRRQGRCGRFGWR